MLALLLSAVLMMQDLAALSPEARALIAPVAEAVAAEEARQAALPPPANDRERLERMGVLDQVGRRAQTPIERSVQPEDQRKAATTAIWTQLWSDGLQGRKMGNRPRESRGPGERGRAPRRHGLPRHSGGV